MNNRPPLNKTLILITGFLLLSNICLLLFFVFGKSPGHSGHADRRQQVKNYLKKDVGFTDGQLATFDSLSDKHRAESKVLFEEMGAKRENIMRGLASLSFSDSAIDRAATAIVDVQKAFEVKMLHHLRDIRSVCTAQQLPVFDTGFYKIIARKGDGRLKNKK